VQYRNCLIAALLITMGALACKKEIKKTATENSFVENPINEKDMLINQWLADTKDIEDIEDIETKNLATDFKQEHGLPLLTFKEDGLQSYFIEKGKCGPIYLSFTNSHKALTKKVWEINSTGEIIQAWGFEQELIHIKNDKLYFISDLAKNISLAASDESPVQYPLHLVSDTNGNIEIIAHEKESGRKEVYTKVDCPEIKQIPAKNKYCVKGSVDFNNQDRLFVMIPPCN